MSQQASVWMDCMFCGAALKVHPEQVFHLCDACRTDVRYLACPKCNAPAQTHAGAVSDLRCEKCNADSRRSDWRKRPATAKRFDPKRRRFKESEPPDVDQRIVAGYVVASSGIAGLHPGSPCVLRFGPDNVGINIPSDSGAMQELGLSYRDVEYLEISGRGTTTRTTDAGLIGGGFGVKDALEGIAIAHVVNSMTRRTSTTTDTAVEFKAGVRHVVMRHHLLDPVALRVLLSPSFERIRTRRRGEETGPPQKNPSVADRLRELTTMHSEGMISDAEFSTMRAKLLSEF